MVSPPDHRSPDRQREREHHPGGRRLLALTETVKVQEFRPGDLETVGRFRYENELSGVTVPAHPQSSFRSCSASFHHVNAFETPDRLTLDLTVYLDAGIVRQLYLDRLRDPASQLALGEVAAVLAGP